MNKKTTITYGAGTLNGDIFVDDFRIGVADGNGQHITVKQMPYGLATDAPFFSGKPNELEAVIGLSYPALGHEGMGDSILGQIKAQKAAKTAMIAFYAPKDQAKQAEMTIGFYDKSKFKGEINWVPVVDEYMFLFKLDDIKINGNSLNICKDKPDGKCMMTVDTGAPETMMPPWMQASFQKMGYPTDKPVDCPNGPEEIGDFTLVIGGKDYTIKNNEWLEEDRGIAKA